jgi:hypothetical protein
MQSFLFASNLHSKKNYCRLQGEPTSRGLSCFLCYLLLRHVYINFWR